MSPYALEEVAKAYWDGKLKSVVGGVGRGAFKETFHVKNEDGQSEALKVYLPGHSAQRNEREVLAIKRCNHPNIARLKSVESFEWKGTKYLVSREEFIAGGTLTNRVATSALDAEETRRLGETLISAVSHIASLDLVHRDLKPDNIMLREDGVSPVIVDFGLVRDLKADSLTQTWALTGPGTPLFAPPEQLLNEKHLIDWRSDQFSLAVLLSFAAFGFHPYSLATDTHAETIERAAKRGPVSDRFIKAARDARLHSLIKMVASWPVERYRRPEQLEEAWKKQGKAP